MTIWHENQNEVHLENYVQHRLSLQAVAAKKMGQTQQFFNSRKSETQQMTNTLPVFTPKNNQTNGFSQTAQINRQRPTLRAKSFSQTPGTNSMRPSRAIHAVFNSEKDPANISYMCLQMKMKLANSQRLLNQRKRVRELSQKMDGFQKHSNHIVVRRNYQHATIRHKCKMDSLLPNDDVNNGGYL